MGALKSILLERRLAGWPSRIPSFFTPVLDCSIELSDTPEMFRTSKQRKLTDKVSKHVELWSTHWLYDLRLLLHFFRFFILASLDFSAAASLASRVCSLATIICNFFFSFLTCVSSCRNPLGSFHSFRLLYGNAQEGPSCRKKRGKPNAKALERESLRNQLTIAQVLLLAQEG